MAFVEQLLESLGHRYQRVERQQIRYVLILNVTFCHLSAGHCASMDSLCAANLDVRHPITAEVILNVFDKRLLVPSQPLGIVA
jgi:hypothetical protein